MDERSEILVESMKNELKELRARMSQDHHDSAPHDDDGNIRTYKRTPKSRQGGIFSNSTFVTSPSPDRAMHPSLVRPP